MKKVLIYLKRVSLLAVMAIFYGCSHYPKDPENSYEEAQQNSLEVGITINPPFTMWLGNSADGSEVSYLKAFAKHEHLKINFTTASESVLINKMNHYKLHIIAAGLDQKTSWKKEATRTAPYDDKHVFLVPRGENRLLQKLENYILSHKSL